ncbi:hypothetical protein HDU81_002354 [Chytriomyces hyalinus]|nr:hypothetical protein HDU81_002354 [Chytriomyces hyalinus]
MLSIALLLAAHAVSALSDTAGLGFQFTASSTDTTTATVCISGKVAQNTYIALGIATTPTAGAGMTGADITLVFADAANAVKVIHGAGGAHVFNADSSVLTLTSASSYANGLLTACFTRPMAPSGAGSLPLVNGSAGYIWATGSVRNGVPVEHAQKGTIANANLFSAVVPGGPATPSKTGGAAGNALLSAFGIVLAAVVA